MVCFNSKVKCKLSAIKDQIQYKIIVLIQKISNKTYDKTAEYIDLISNIYG